MYAPDKTKGYTENRSLHGVVSARGVAVARRLSSRASDLAGEKAASPPLFFGEKL